jgi:arylsulfatase
MGHRGIWVDGWKATTYHEPGHPYDLDEWELFHLDADFSECHDLSGEQPDRLRDLVDVWWSEAGAMGVLPLDDRTIELFGSEVRPGTPHGGTTYVYRAPVSHIPADASPLLGGRAWTITAHVAVDGAAPAGVLYARGSHNVGHSFFVGGGHLHFDYNALGTHHRASAPLQLSPGVHTLFARFDRTGSGGVLTIGADGVELDSVEIPWIVRMLGSTGMDVGCDRLSEVVDDYRGPNPFTGRIERLVVELRSRMGSEDVATTARVELARE